MLIRARNGYAHKYIIIAAAKTADQSNVEQHIQLHIREFIACLHSYPSSPLEEDSILSAVTCKRDSFARVSFRGGGSSLALCSSRRDGGRDDSAFLDQEVDETFVG